MQQTGFFSMPGKPKYNPKISGRRRCGLSAVKGWWDCTVWAKCDIYDCLVFACDVQTQNFEDKHKSSVVYDIDGSDGWNY